MVCKNCGNPLADGVKFCTKCGQRVEEVATEVKEAAAEATVEVKEEVTEATAEVKEEVKEATAEIKETAAESKEEAKEEVNEVKEKVADVAEDVKETVTEVATEVKEAVEGAKKKVKKFPKAALIVVAVIALVLIVVLANFKTVTNTVNKLVSSEEKYYASVESDEIKELASSVANVYENSFLEYIDYRDLSVDYGVEVELSEDAYEMLAAAIGTDDGKPFSKMAVDFFMSFKGDVISAEAAATLGKTQLISAKGVADLKRGEAYGQIAELTDKYIGVNFEEYAETISEALAQSDEFLKVLPDKKTVESLLNRYLTIAVENIEGVTEKKDTIKVGDIEQKCTAIRVRIRQKDMEKIAIAILEEAKDDKELISLVADIAAAAAKLEGAEAVDAKEYEEMFQAQIEAALEEAKGAESDSDEEDDEESDEDSESAIIMNVWVNNKGEVIGRELKFDDETLFVYKMPEKGGKFEFKASLFAEGDEIILDGSGKKNSSSLSGEFGLKMKEGDEKAVKFIDIDVEKFDTKKIKQGFLNGSFTFSLSDEFMQEADMGMASAIIGDYQIKYDVKSSKNSGNVELALMNKDEMFAKLIVEAKIGSGKSASLPNGIIVEDEEDIIKWAKTIKFDKFIKKLEKAGLPEEIMEPIEDACSDLEDMLSDY